MINAKQELLNIINPYMTADPAVCERLKTELDYIMQNERYAEIFMAARGMVMLSRELAYYTNFRGSLGSSLVAFLLGITEIDPLKYNLPFEVFAGLHNDKRPDIELNFDEKFIPQAQKYIQDTFPDVIIRVAGNAPANNEDIVLCGLSVCATIKKLADITGVDIKSIPFDDEAFDDSVRTFGIEHGTYVWDKRDNDTGKRLITSDMPPYSEIIAFRDDIMLYLIDKGIDRTAAYAIMENVRKGKGLSDEHKNIMTAAGVPDWYIESCKSVKYLFPKAHAITYVMMSLRLAWFEAHYPAEFQKVSK